ncbi:MAG: DUF1080 domain-containing protein [Armatimonadota bacterium]
MIEVIAVCAAMAAVSTNNVNAQTQVPVVAVTPASAAPAGAKVLFGGRQADVAANWYKRRTTNAPGWTIGNEAQLVPSDKSDITTREEFGDCYLHVEFKTPATGHGNAGVALQGRYEVQIHNMEGEKLSNTNLGAFYSQKPARVNAAKKAGEWQTYDIVFRAPRFDAAGKEIEKPRATVILNGIVVHNNESFNDMTGIQYELFKGPAAKGPIVLQGDHDAVQYRNVWVIGL